MFQNRHLALPVALALSSTALTAQLQPYGDGCSTGLVPLRLELNQPDQSILPGGIVTLVAGQLPSGAPTTLLLGLGKNLGGVPLDSLGMPGCSLYHSADIAVSMRSSAPDARATLVIPNIACAEFYAQAVSVVPGANQLGVVTSNAATIGSPVVPVGDRAIKKAGRSARRISPDYVRVGHTPSAL